ncbi:hypothetical protein Tco_0047716 [Tanacetum coccineum]
MAHMALSDSKVKQEKEGFEFKIAKFKKSAKDLDQLLGIQHYFRLIIFGREEFKDPEVNEYSPRATTGCDKEEKFFYPANHVESVNKIEKPVRKNNDAPIIEEWVSDDEDEVESPVVVKKKTVIPTAAKIEKLVRKTVRELSSVISRTGMLLCGMVFITCKYNCKHKRHVNGQREEKPVWKNTRRVNDHYSTRMTHSNLRRNMIPQVVLMRSGIKAVNTAKPKNAHNAVKRNSFNTVKASACWV